MQRILYILCISLFLVSCNKENTTDGFLVEGNLDKSLENALIKLVRSDNGQVITLDSTRANGNTFQLKGNVESPDMYFLSVEGAQGGLPVIIENENIKLTIHIDSLPTSIISGGKQNEYFNNYQTFIKTLRDKNNKLSAKFQIAQKNQDTAQISILRKEYEDIMKENDVNDLDFMTTNTESILSSLILERSIIGNKLEITKIKELYTNFDENIKNSRSGRAVLKFVTNNEKTAIGSVVPNFSAPSVDGKEIALNDIKGKVTIIDFWAAWCGPCRRENPNVVKVYEKYHDKGLEIIGISLDGTPKQKDAKQAWLDAIEKDNLTWHHVSNLQYFNDPIAKQFNINSIPATFIIDADGKIVAKNLRGQALENKIAELLN